VDRRTSASSSAPKASTQLASLVMIWFSVRAELAGKSRPRLAPLWPEAWPITTHRSPQDEPQNETQGAPTALLSSADARADLRCPSLLQGPHRRPAWPPRGGRRISSRPG